MAARARRAMARAQRQRAARLRTEKEVVGAARREHGLQAHGVGVRAQALHRQDLLLHLVQRRHHARRRAAADEVALAQQARLGEALDGLRRAAAGRKVDADRRRWRRRARGGGGGGAARAPRGRQTPRCAPARQCRTRPRRGAPGTCTGSRAAARWGTSSPASAQSRDRARRGRYQHEAPSARTAPPRAPRCPLAPNQQRQPARQRCLLAPNQQRQRLC